VIVKANVVAFPRKTPPPPSFHTHSREPRCWTRYIGPAILGAPPQSSTRCDSECCVSVAVQPAQNCREPQDDVPALLTGLCTAEGLDLFDAPPGDQAARLSDRGAGESARWWRSARISICTAARERKALAIQSSSAGNTAPSRATGLPQTPTTQLAMSSL
jgi:hypothetical protein